jgi:hypothetical protein
MVLVAEEFEGGVSVAGWAMWACEKCRDWSALAVGRRQFAALQALGGHLDGRGHAAWPPAQAEDRPPDGELSLDDLIDLHRLLEQPDWFEQLLRFPDGTGRRQRTDRRPL